ncbi:MAG: hypothetical protein V1706_07290 [Pseudomonadota bacterium]
MMADENEMNQQFYNVLMRLRSEGDASFVADTTGRNISGKELEDILMEIELLEDEDLDCFAADFDNAEVSRLFFHPLIAVSKCRLCDSRKNWKLRKVVFGSRLGFSA